MPHPSDLPQLAVGPVSTNSTSNIAVPESAAHCRRRRIRLARLLGPILLLLPWSPGLAQDPPTAPVHLAVTSAESAEMTVDLSDPTKFPLSSTGKWTGYLEFLGKPGTERSLGQPDLFLPLLQDVNDMTFFNLRGQLQFDNTDVHEYNVGLGHRHMLQEWILGGYGYFDHRNTQFNSSYNQFTGGLELMSVDWDFRVNGYLPENKTETIMSGANVSVIRPGDQINVQVDGIVQEKALPGLDGEVGYLLPIPWKAYTAVFDETRVYAGGYHFLGEDQFESVTGPRGRVEWRAYDLPVLGPGSRFMMGVEAQWDEPRGSQAFGLASLRIPFDVFSDKSTRKQLAGLDRRMLQPVIRDVDIVTSEADVPAEILPALNQAGQAYTLVKEPDLTGLTDSEKETALQKVLDDHQDGTVLVIPKDEDNGGMITLANSIVLHRKQTLGGAGGRGGTTVNFQSPSLGSGSIGYAPDGAAKGFLAGSGFDPVKISMINMAPDTEVNGLTLDANNIAENSIRIRGDEDADPGKRWLANNNLINTWKYPLLARGHGIEVDIDNSHFSGGGKSGISVNEFAIVDIKNSHFYNNFHSGIWVSQDAILTVSDSYMYNNQRGMEINSGAKVTIVRSEIYGNDLWGVYAYDGVTVDISDSTIYDNGWDGVRTTTWNGPVDLTVVNSSENVEAQSTITFDSVTITGNKRYGIRNEGAEVTVINSRVFDNALGSYMNEIGVVKEWVWKGNKWNHVEFCIGNDGFINVVDGDPIPQTPSSLGTNAQCDLAPDLRPDS